MIDNNKYRLPPEVFAAVNSGRSELLNHVAIRTLRQQDVKEILRLLADMINDRREAEAKALQDRDVVVEALRTISAHTNKLETVLLGVVREEDE